MKITRDVVYDLLPGYFAGDVSADTRALIDEFMSTDPEFARMTARFHRLFEERASSSGGDVTPEREHVERARKRAEALQICSAFAVAFGLAAVFPHVMDFVRGRAFPGTFFLSAVFGTIAVASAIGWLSVRLRSA